MAHEINGDAAVVLEQCEVAPPPGSVPSTTLPLTFLDIPWSYSLPIQRIFFFEFPHPTHHFLQQALPTLKQSLSITLQHFFPFASNLIIPPPQPHIAVAPYIRYLHGDSLHLTVAESNSDFDHLVSDSPQDVRNLHPLVPTLPSPRTEEDGTRVIPLMAIQVTILPNSGFSICLTFNHLAADGKSLHHFIKYWSSVCRKTVDSASPEAEAEATLSVSLPFHDRNRVKDPKGLKLMYLRDLQRPAESETESMEFAGDVFSNKVRATLVLSREQVEKLKKWITLKLGTPQVSTFVVTCSLIWVCMIKSEQRKSDDCVAKGSDELCCVLFPADCRHRPELSLPSTYFGNCLVGCNVAMKRGELVGENGIIEAANAVEKKIRNWKSGPIGYTETSMSDFKELLSSAKSFLTVAGSPKLGVYETDFGWGRPKKSESVHIDASGSISLSDCRDKQGGIEIGLVLERSRMNDFINILEQQITKATCD